MTVIRAVHITELRTHAAVASWNLVPSRDPMNTVHLTHLEIGILREFHRLYPGSGFPVPN